MNTHSSVGMLFGNVSCEVRLATALVHDRRVHRGSDCYLKLGEISAGEWHVVRSVFLGAK
jgi:hypothetical protein